MTVDCTHPRANHQHGTYLAWYRDGCRCVPCVTAARRYAKMSAYRTATGTHTYVDAAAARQHVLALLEVLTVSQIESRSGVHRTAIRILVGDWPGKAPSKRITRKTERALLDVSAERVGAEQTGLVDPTGTVRRLQALCAIGWPAATLTARLGCSNRTTWLILNDHHTMPVTVRVRDEVRALFDELSMKTPAPSRQVTLRRRLSAERGHLPPLAWDEDTIDDPDVTPEFGDAETFVDDIAIRRVILGEGHAQLTSREVDAAIALGTREGLTNVEIAERLRMSKAAVEQRMIRRGLTRRVAA